MSQVSQQNLDSGRVIITGATGNTGSCVVSLLASAIPPQNIVALVRRQSDCSELDRLGIQTHPCDLDSVDTYRDVIQKNDRFVGVANLRFSDRMLPFLVDMGVSRAYVVTTTAVYSTFHSYSQLYRDIEVRLQSHSIPVTLLRPSMIYGNARDHNMHKLVSTLKRAPVFPVFGPGTALMQPVFVDDLAEGIVAAIRTEAQGAFDLAGPEPLSYDELLVEVANALGKKVRLFHISHRMSASLVKRLENVPGFPVKHEQVMRLLEDKAFDISRAKHELGYRPRQFSDGIREQIATMNIIGR